MAPRNIFVIGATGQQGSATITNLLDHPADTTPSIHVLGLTRDLTSSKSKALSEKYPSTLALVQGTIDDPEAIFSAHPDINALYLFTLRGKEDIIGKAWIDTALSHNVSQIVLSTVDRGGDERSWTNPTDIPHFMKKHAVEIHLRDKAEEVAKSGKQLFWTIFRPAAFLDNMNPVAFGKFFGAMWSTMPADRKIQFVSTRDVGLFAAKALADPAGWDRKAVALAGDEMTYGEARETFQRVVGQPLPQTWSIFGRGLLWSIDDLGKMFKWFDKEGGYGAKIEGLRRQEPRLQTFETWLRETSGWKSSISK
jgi:uncharacterized protein YbjT (DUF2867 family)